MNATATITNQWDSTVTIEERFNQALKDIRKGGVKARRNVSGCCGSCVAAETNLPEGTPIIWHFGGQGHAFGFQGGKPYLSSDLYGSRSWSRMEMVDGIYFNHDGLVTNDKINEKGQFVLDTFAVHGIVAKWDGSDFKCIEIDFKASEAM